MDKGFVKTRVSMVHDPNCPDPSKARTLCDCGENVSCSACGWGSGTHPCRCTRERMAAAK